jgi:hypothetical protein
MMFDPLKILADLNGISRTATDILAAVQKTIATHAATQVTIVGHSLGAFIFGIEFCEVIDLLGFILYRSRHRPS